MEAFPANGLSNGFSSCPPAVVMARRVVQASKVAALCAAIPNPIQIWSLWRSSSTNWPTDTVIGLPDFRKAFSVGPFTGTGSGASGRSVESETAAGRIDTTEETGVNGREISLKKVRLAGEEFVGGMSAIFSAGKPICA